MTELKAGINSMKIYSSIFFLLLTSGAHAGFLSSEDALDFLEKTRPIAAGAFVAVQNSPTELKLYNKQLEAIAALTNSTNIQGVKILIPYLNYAVNYAVIVAGPNPMLKREDLTDTKQSWPAFAAILQMQDASDQLQKYCLDNQNPINYRLAAFLVLRYVDQKAFQNTEHLFDAALADSKLPVKQYLKRIEDGSAQFWGVPDLK